MMNSNMIYALRVSGRTFAEDAAEAGTVTLLGMVAIFSVLALLWLVIEILHRALTGQTATKVQEKKEAKPQRVAPPKPAPAAKPAPAVESAPAAPVTDDGALIAAITAAITAARAEDGYTGGFRVVSFKRSSRKSGRN